MRFLVQTKISTAEPIELTADRAHYLTKVMRHKVGDVVECFDGNGTIFDAQLSTVGNKRCTLLVINQRPIAQRPVVKLHLGISLLKGQAMDRAIQQATELGASSICLLNAHRNNVHLTPERLDNKMSHWQKIIAGACEQSGQLYLPTLTPLESLEHLITTTDTEIIILDMQGEKLPATLPRAERTLLVGPEGGWDEDERRLFAAHQLTHYQLTGGTLRAETVPSVALALFSHLQQL
jgi:16S rRNA (uracil1498-N3)-methyltransferase